jgi:hypothetical protein
MTRHSLLADSAVRSRSKKPGYYLDGSGLYLQVSKTGSRSWIFRYTLNGKTREMGLGSLTAFGLAQARERAQRARQLLADGIDPIEKRGEERKAIAAHRTAERARAKTFENCAREYHEASADEWKNAKHAAQWINTLTQYAFPKFGSLPVGDVGKAEIVSALAPLWKSKAETASRLLQRIRTVLNFAAARDYSPGKDAEFWQYLRHVVPLETDAPKIVRGIIANMRQARGEFDPAKPGHIAVFCYCVVGFAIAMATVARDIFDAFDPKQPKDVFQRFLRDYIWGGAGSVPASQETQRGHGP